MATYIERLQTELKRAKEKRSEYENLTDPEVGSEDAYLYDYYDGMVQGLSFAINNIYKLP